MKKLSKLFAAVAFVFVATFSLTAQNMPVQLCDGKITVNVKEIAPCCDGSYMNVCYDITVAPDAIEGCTSFVITPVIYNDEAKKVLEVIVVNGVKQKGSDAWLEQQCYDVADPSNVKFLRAKEGEYTYINTCTSVPMEEWMNDSKFSVTTQQATYKPNCIKPLCGTQNVCDVPYLAKPLVVDPLLADLNTNGKFSTDPIRKVRTILYYPVNVTKSVDSYLENADALSLLNTLNSPNFEVTNINIEGWASPEATVPYNNNLSVKRAATMKKIISDKYDFPSDVYTTNGNGEYWDKAINYIATTDEPVVADNRDAIQDAIENNGDLDKREAAIKKIAGGKPYKAIFDATYPRSRFADCEVLYRFKEYNREDAIVLFNTDPSQLTAEDYAYMLNDEYNQMVMDKALELYPNDEVLNAIAASKAYANGEYDDAIKYYKKAGNSQEVMNNLACAYLMACDPDNAKACLDKAKDLKVAESNANEYRKVVLNNKYFGSNNVK